jgi:hypothetical protein
MPPIASGGEGMIGTPNAKIERALKAVSVAENEACDVLRKEYPGGSHVVVNHTRGTFYGNVVGIQRDGAYLRIQNQATNKITKQWYRYVTKI